MKTTLISIPLTMIWLIGGCTVSHAAPARDVEALATLGRGQTRDVTCLAYSPDGKVLALGCEDGKVRLWDASTGAEKMVLQAHKISTKYVDSVNCVSFSADGKLLATAGDDNTTKVWDTGKGVLQTTFKGHTKRVFAVAFHRDGKLVASCGDDDTARVWHAATGKEECMLECRRVSALAFSPDGTKLYLGSWDHTIKVWDLGTFKECGALQGRASGPRCLAFSPDGKILASAGTDTEASSIQLWDVKAGKAKLEWDVKGDNVFLWSVAWAPDGQGLFTACRDNTIRLWDASTGKQKARLDGHLGNVACLAMSPDGKTLASGASVPLAGGEVRLWDVQAAKAKALVQDHIGKVLSVTFSPDGKTIASGGIDKTVRIWDLATSRVRTILRDDETPFSLCFSPDGKMLAAGGSGMFSRHRVKLWDIAQSKQAQIPPPDEKESYYFGVAFDVAGQTLVAARIGGIVEFWDIKNSAKKDSLEIPGQWRLGAHLLAQSADGGTVALAEQELMPFKIKVWDAKTKKERTTAEHDATNGIALSPDGKILASGGRYGRIKLWDVETGKEIAELTDKYQPVECVAFSPDGKMLASAHEDNGIRLWDVKTRKVLNALRGHTDSVWSICFSPDGKTLASASLDGTIKLWDIDKR